MPTEDAPVLVTPLPDGVKLAFREKFHLQREVLAAELDRVFKTKPALVVFDLTAVESIASEGLGRLVFFRNRIVSAGGKIKSIGVSPRILEIMAVARILPVLNVDSST